MRGGVPFIEVLNKGELKIKLFAPRGRDLQTPHQQDEIYVIVQGTSEFLFGDKRIKCKFGDVLFVPAKTEHRFENFSEDFATWVFFV
ncbi:MAG: cupin domain-containing protein [Acidobacteria bacterium]|nr:cupin domain-containing protein [Acidobacteriota bacterium]MCA1636876.1 cupin domain-containing protein [Acidobacteriota bacterium]